MLLGSQAVSDLLTLAGGDRETPPWNNDLLLWDIFQRAFGMSTLPNMPNNAIRKYYPLFSVKQGSERVSNLPKATQQGDIRAIEEVKPGIGLGVCRGGSGDFCLCLFTSTLDHGHSCWALSSPQQMLSSRCHGDWPCPQP